MFSRLVNKYRRLFLFAEILLQQFSLEIYHQPFLYKPTLDPVIWYFGYPLPGSLSRCTRVDIARCEVMKANQGGTWFAFCFRPSDFPVDDCEWTDGGEMVNDEAAIKPAAGK